MEKQTAETGAATAPSIEQQQAEAQALAEKTRAEREAYAAKLPKTLVYLGGTKTKVSWREPFTQSLIAAGYPATSIFNPLPEVPRTDADLTEAEAKARAKWLLYYIGNPGHQTLPISADVCVEAAILLFDDPERTVVVFDHANLFDQTGPSGVTAVSFQRAERLLTTRFPKARIFGSLTAALAFFSGDLAGVAPGAPGVGPDVGPDDPRPQLADFKGKTAVQDYEKAEAAWAARQAQRPDLNDPEPMRTGFTGPGAATAYTAAHAAWVDRQVVRDEAARTK